jgi:type II secretory pathway component PulF
MLTDRYNKNPSLRELSLFTRQLALTLRAGIPLTKSLRIAISSVRSKAFKMCVAEAISLIEQHGKGFAEALTNSHASLPLSYIALLTAGERAGILDDTLHTLAQRIDQQCALKTSLIRAALYPIIVCVVLIFICLALLIWVVPTFSELFKDSGIALPLLTRSLVTLSELLLFFLAEIASLGVSVIAPIGVAFILLGWFKGVSWLKLAIARIFALSWHIPLLRVTLRLKDSAEGASLLAALIKVGIPIGEGLVIASQGVGSPRVQRELKQIRSAIFNGSSLSQAFRDGGYFPESLAQLIEVGESAGSLDEVLFKGSELYTRQVEDRVDGLKQLFEPLMVLIIGFVVGVLVLALYQPVFQMGEVAGVGR